MGQKKPQNFFGGVKKTRWGKKKPPFLKRIMLIIRSIMQYISIFDSSDAKKCKIV